MFIVDTDVFHPECRIQNNNKEEGKIVVLPFFKFFVAINSTKLN